HRAEPPRVPSVRFPGKSAGGETMTREATRLPAAPVGSFPPTPTRAVSRPLLVLLLSAAALIATRGTSRAASFVWRFSSSNSSCAAVPSSPIALCNSDYNTATAVFQDDTGTYFITARGYDLGSKTSPTTLVVGTTTWSIVSPASPNNHLWGKFTGTPP